MVDPTVVQDVTLFERIPADKAPLAERMRPRTFEAIVGQERLLGAGSVLARAIEEDRVPSMILWGPPGTGKTTIARALAARSRDAALVPFSAVLSGVPELRKVIDAARERRRSRGSRTILFVDEIHRWNKAQQDALLPHVEDGTLVLVGATTENPSFAINAALLSRVRVFRLEPHTPASIEAILRRALADGAHGLGKLALDADDDALAALGEAASGDARRALDVLEFAAEGARSRGATRLARGDVEEALAEKTLLYDKSGDQHYDVVSAFIKSMRGNAPDAALYWMMRMLDAGDDPLFVMRRMLIFASEDVGNADPQALSVAVNADAAVRRLGMPEALHPLAQCCTYLASTVKSNASYVAWRAAREAVEANGPLAVPMHLRNAPTRLMKAEGYGEGYRYPHDEGGHAPGATYLPERLLGARFYEPKNSGFESKLRARLERLRAEDEAFAEERSEAAAEGRARDEDDRT